MQLLKLSETINFMRLGVINASYFRLIRLFGR